MKTRWMMILLLVLLLTLAGCDTPADEDAISTSVAATLGSMDTIDTDEPVEPIPPTATLAVVEDPTLPTPTETPTPGPVTDEEAIKDAMNEYLDSPVDESSITVSEIMGDLARGGLQGAYFIAAKDGGVWIIVYAGQATPYCHLVNPYGFPTEWVPECLDEDDSLVQRTEEDADADITSLGSPTWTDSMDTASRWYLLSTSNVTFTMEGGSLVMEVHEGGGYDEWGIAAGADITDFYLEITARMGNECSGIDRYGLIFRAPDPSKGYIFEFSCDGRFRLYKWDGEEYTGIQGWKSSSLILSGPNKENRLGVMTDGSDVRLYANGKLLGEYAIDDYPQGRFGLVVGSTNTDNFKVMVDTASFWDL
ncbi:MAG: hypothetical protein WBB65_00435 [Anaerolineales bacterium]